MALVSLCLSIYLSICAHIIHWYVREMRCPSKINNPHTDIWATRLFWGSWAGESTEYQVNAVITMTSYLNRTLVHKEPLEHKTQPRGQVSSLHSARESLDDTIAQQFTGNASPSLIIAFTARCKIESLLLLFLHWREPDSRKSHLRWIWDSCLIILMLLN